MNTRYSAYFFVTLTWFPLCANQSETYSQLLHKNAHLVKTAALIGAGLFLGRFMYNKLTKQKITQQPNSYSPTLEELQTVLKKVGRTPQRQQRVARKVRPSSVTSPSGSGININIIKRRSSSSYSTRPWKTTDGNEAYALATSLQKSGELEEALFHLGLAVQAGHKQAQAEYPEMAFLLAVQEKKDGNHIEAHEHMLKAAEAGHIKAKKKCAKIAFELAEVTKQKNKINATIEHLKTAQNYGHPQAKKEIKRYIDNLVDDLPDSLPLAPAHSVY